ncbi:MAG TPA: protoheme IX farnesyltransferase, partial [Nitrospirota bacterium]
LCLACVFMAAAGSSVINILLEQETDALMPRVSGRAAAIARIGRPRAFLAACGLILFSAALAGKFLSLTASALICLAAISYTTVYTLYLKRKSPFGTVLGGIPGALPVLIGYASVRPAIGFDAFVLFLVMMLWQPPHFLALALSHRCEYAAAGLPVMPVSMGEPYTRAFAMSYVVALIPAASALFFAGTCSGFFAAVSLALGFCLATCFYIFLFRTDRFGLAFASSIAYIVLLFVGIIADSWMA